MVRDDQLNAPPNCSVSTVSNFNLNHHEIKIVLVRVPEGELQAILEVIGRIKELVKLRGGTFTGG